MQVELLKYPTEKDWELCKICTFVTIGKDGAKTAPTEEWKRKILAACHSPIRTLEFCFRMTDVPSWVATHLARHVHAVPFVKTQRTDRTGEDRNELPQGAPVDMCYFVNAEELMTIAHKRLCTQASKETRELVQMMCDEVLKVCPEFEGLLVPLCEYRGGVCTEFYPCGRSKR